MHRVLGWLRAKWILVAAVLAGSATVATPLALTQGGGGIDVIVGGTPTPTATPEDLPPLGEPSCVPGATNVTTAAAAASALSSGDDVCLTAAVADLSLSGGSWSSAGVEHLGTSETGSFEHITINGPVGLNLRVRAESISLRDCSNITIEQSRLGGEDHTDRTTDQVIEGLDTLVGCDDSVIQDNEIAWTEADNSGNTGYGLRIYGDNDDLIVRRNWIHDIAADGIQGVGGDNVLIDRNEIGPVGVNPGSSEHSDSMQLEDWGPGTEVTNNWSHHQGYFTDSGGVLDQVGGSGNIYVHGGNVGDNSLLVDNNLFQESVGRTEFCGLGSGGTDVKNVTVTDNTWYDLGQTSGLSSTEWDCATGSGNTYSRNISVDEDNGFSFGATGSAGSVTRADNISGQLADVTLDADGNCTSANCTGSPAIGYRKPSDVHW